MAAVSHQLKGQVYIDRDGDRITRQKWEELRRNREYTYLKEYDNGRFYVAVIWMGQIEDAANKPEQFWKPYNLIVQNILSADPEGLRPNGPPRYVNDPELCQAFKNAEDALHVYEDHLVRYCNCKWVPSPGGAGSSVDKDQHFIEYGNTLGPPPPDAPQLKDVPGAELVGSW